MIHTFLKIIVYVDIEDLCAVDIHRAPCEPNPRYLPTSATVISRYVPDVGLIELLKRALPVSFAERDRKPAERYVCVPVTLGIHVDLGLK